MADHTIGRLEYRRAGEAAGFFRMLQAMHGVACKGRIGCDHAVDFVLHQQLGDPFDLRIFKIGRNFHQQRHILAMPVGESHLLALHAFHDACEFILVLQLAQVFGVGR